MTHVPFSSAELPSLDMSKPPWPGELIDLGETRLHVRKTQGSPDSIVVYLHGLGGSATNWTDLAAQLAPSATGLAPDLPGFGFTEPASTFDFALDSHADVIAAYLRSIGSRVHLVGNSMGGAIALLLAAKHPDLIRTLTLISPAMPDRRPDPRRLSDPRMALTVLPLVGRSVSRRLARLDPIERARQVIQLCYADPRLCPEHRLAELAEEHHARLGFAWAQPAAAKSTLDIFRTWLSTGAASLWSVAPNVVAPTLVVWGSEDKVISVRKAPRTAKLIPLAKLLILPRTGHVAQMERPVTVAKAMLGLWEQVAVDKW